MIHKTITLSEERNVSFTTYFLENSPEYQNGIARPLIVVCPGGGYSFLSDREGEPVALRFANAGFHTVVLRYGIGEHAVAPGPLKDIADCVCYLKEHAGEYRIDRENIFVCGFSAGAHVAGQLGCFWNNKELLPDYAGRQEMIRPAGMILCYPVLDLRQSVTGMDIGVSISKSREEINFDQKHPKMPLESYFIADEASGHYLVDFEKAMNAYIFDGEYTDEQEDFYSLQNQVSKDTPPAFLWHCAGDGLIFPANSLEFAGALAREGIDYELHIFNGGQHGIAMADYVTANDFGQYYAPAEKWMDLASSWVNRISGFEEKIRTHYIQA